MLVISHLLQPVVRLLLRPAAAVVVVVVVVVPQNNLTSQALASDSESVSAARISLMAPSSSFIFFPAISRNLQSSALFRLLCMTGQIWRNIQPLQCECLIQWQQNRTKAVMWQLYMIPAIRGCPRRFYWIDGCVLHVSTPQPLYITPALQEACVGPPVAVNIDFCGCLIFEHWFCLNYMGTVCHWQPFWSIARICFIGQCWYFNPQWTPVQAIIKASSVRTLLVSWVKCAVAVCLHIYRCLWRGLRDGGVHSGSWMKA